MVAVPDLFQGAAPVLLPQAEGHPIGPRSSCAFQERGPSDLHRTSRLGALHMRSKPWALFIAQERQGATYCPPPERGDQVGGSHGPC